MARMVTLANIETADLKIGDIVLWEDGTLATFQGRDPIVGSEYETIFWGDSFEGPCWHSTAQPWNTWPASIRLIEN